MDKRESVEAKRLGDMPIVGGYTYERECKFGEPVYRIVPSDDGEVNFTQVTLLGITLRQHYAGLAMQGILATPGGMASEDIARAAVFFSDALLAELAKEPK